MRRYARTGRWKTLRIGWTFAGFLVVTIALGGACADATAPRFTPLNINRLNLIFLPAADTNPATGLLTPRGLQRSLRLDAWLAKIIVSVGDIHAVAPTIMPAASRDSDALNALESVEQLALEYDAPIDASAPGQCGSPCPSRGLDGADIRNADGANEKLVEGIIAAAHRSRATGNHVFSMPAKLLNNLLEYVNLAENFHLKIPQRATDQHDTVYVISIDRANHATLELYRFPVDPPPGYPKIRLTESNACLQPRVTISTRELGLTPLAGLNTNERVYFVRHAEAHPNNQFENGNYVCRGQWRALGAPAILYRKITADTGGRRPHNFAVYGPDPSYPVGVHRNSYVRAALTVEPFAIAYGLPMHLANGVDWNEWNTGESAAIRFFFMHEAVAGANAGFSNATLLIGWEHFNIGQMVKDLLDNYYRPARPDNSAQLPVWNGNDYDTIWIVSLDANGNLAFTNDCEGVPSATLPTSCPTFSNNPARTPQAP